MSEIKYIFELTEEEVKLLAYGAMPRELKEKLIEIAYYIDSRKKIEAVEERQKKSEKINAENYIIRIRREFPKAYTKWTFEEDINLKKMFNTGKSIKELSRIFQRQTGGINSRLVKLGLIEDTSQK